MSGCGPGCCVTPIQLPANATGKLPDDGAVEFPPATPEWSFWLLPSTWPSPCCFGNFRKGDLCHSDSQINKS